MIDEAKPWRVELTWKRPIDLAHEAWDQEQAGYVEVPANDVRYAVHHDFGTEQEALDFASAFIPVDGHAVLASSETYVTEMRGPRSTMQVFCTAAQSGG